MLRHLARRGFATAPPPSAVRAALVASTREAVSELSSLLDDAPGPSSDSRSALLHDVREHALRARRGARSSALQEDLLGVLHRHHLGAGGSNTAVLTAAAGELRERREACWANILGRGTDAAGVGFLLRGFYVEHGKMMDAEELGELEQVLSRDSQELAALLSGSAAPPALAALPVFRLLCQFGRYWSGAGHEPGGEYV